MGHAAAQALRLIADLQHAVENDELRLHEPASGIARSHLTGTLGLGTIDRVRNVRRGTLGSDSDLGTGREMTSRFPSFTLSGCHGSYSPRVFRYIPFEANGVSTT